MYLTLRACFHLDSQHFMWSLAWCGQWLPCWGFRKLQLCGYVWGDSLCWAGRQRKHRSVGLGEHVVSVRFLGTEGRGSGWEFLHLLTGLCRPIPGQQSKSIPRPPMAPTCFPRCWHFQKPAANDPGLGDPQNMGDGSWGRGQDGARRAL